MKAKMPFIEKKVDDSSGIGTFAGILGLSPNDESAGPLFIQYLYE